MRTVTLARAAAPKGVAAGDGGAPDVPARPVDRWTRRGAVAVIAAALGFNAVLSIVNGHIAPINGAVVTAVQGAIMAAAIGIGLIGRNPGWLRWVALLWGAVLLWLTLSILRQSLELKSLGDAALIPAFALAGACLDRRTLLRLLISAQLLITAVAVWDLFAPQSYGDFFQVRDYYVSTRGIVEREFWSEDDTLYLNVQRPNERLFFPGSDLHRASSIFLEPVSLGNWMVIVTIVLISFWRNFTVPTRMFLLGSSLFLLVACDGRFALAASIVVLATVPIAYLRRWWPLIYLPAVLVTLFAMRAFELLERGGDTFGGRLNKGVVYLERLDLLDLLGAKRVGAYANADAGWAYLIQGQSIFGLIGFWLVVVLFNTSERIDIKRFVNGIAVFFALCMPVSYSFTSIKSMAPIFAVYGCLIALSLRGQAGAAPVAMDRRGRLRTAAAGS